MDSQTFSTYFQYSRIRSSILMFKALFLDAVNQDHSRQANASPCTPTATSVTSVFYCTRWKTIPVASSRETPPDLNSSFTAYFHLVSCTTSLSIYIQLDNWISIRLSGCLCHMSYFTSIRGSYRSYNPSPSLLLLSRAVTAIVQSSGTRLLLHVAIQSSGTSACCQTPSHTIQQHTWITIRTHLNFVTNNRDITYI